VLRCGGIAGMTLPHKCTADTVIGGHIIPEGRALAVSYSMQQHCMPYRLDFAASILYKYE